MASPRKRPSPPLDVDPRTDAVPGTDASDLDTEGSCEPPHKKLCKSPVSDCRPSSESTGESSPAFLKTEATCEEPAFRKLDQAQGLHGHPSSKSAAESSSSTSQKTEGGFEPAFKKLDQSQDVDGHPGSKSAGKSSSPAGLQTEDGCEPAFKKPYQSQDSHGRPSFESTGESSHTAEDPAAPAAADDDLSPGELETLEQLSAASQSSQTTSPVPATADASDVHGDDFSPDEIEALETLSAASQNSQATPAPVATDGFDVHDDDLGPDEFESLDELLGIPQNGQATNTLGHGVTSQPGPVPSPETDVGTPKIDPAQRRHATTAAQRAGASRHPPISYTEFDLEMPKIDAGEESDDSGVIDLTRDAEFEIGRSDGFMGAIKPGIQGVTVKRKSVVQPTVTPTRRPLAPVSKNTPPPRHAFSKVKHEDQRTPAQDFKTALVNFEDEDKKPSRRKRPADGPPKLTSSPSFDMAKFLINEQKLAAMPSAAQPPALKTKLLKHQRQVIFILHTEAACPRADSRQALQWMVDMEKPHDPSSGPSARLAQFWGPRARRDADIDAYANVESDALANASVTPFSGGILADDMGLGKTLEMIALIMREPKSAPTLIVAPKGVLSNWESQIRRHIRWDHAPRLLRFHSSRGYTTPGELARNDIIITTYNKLADEAYGEGTLRRLRLRRVILDEGHTIRNPDSKAALAACMLQAKSNWVCTGTPM